MRCDAVAVWYTHGVAIKRPGAALATALPVTEFASRLSKSDAVKKTGISEPIIHLRTEYVDTVLVGALEVIGNSRLSRVVYRGVFDKQMGITRVKG